jgi:hypothetical protein
MAQHCMSQVVQLLCMAIQSSMLSEAIDSLFVADVSSSPC